MNIVRPVTGAVEISIIVPVYNVAPFIEECLQSIHQQSFKHRFEAILIDDCSTDRSLDICRQFAKTFPATFKLIEKPLNQGVCATRNTGLEAMSGNYFMFVDPDDRLPPNSLSDLFLAAAESGASIVKGNNVTFNQSREKASRFNVSQRSLVSGPAILTTLYEHEKVRGHVWGKLFRSDSLGKHRFPEGVTMVEDLFYCCEVFAHADSLYFLNCEVYRYRNHDRGATGTKYDRHSHVEWVEMVEKTLKFASNRTQVRAHKNLLLRTMTQLARECRGLPPGMARKVLPVIEDCCDRWNLRLSSLLLQDGQGIRSISRYVKLQMALREIRRDLTRQES